MPRRATLRTACKPCRQSRTKCDSSLCCARCKERNLDCIYDSVSIVSKEALRDQVKDLQGRLEDADALLNALHSSTGQYTSENALEIIREGLERQESRASIVRRLNDINEAGQCPGMSPAPVSVTSSSDADSAVEIMDMKFPSAEHSTRLSAYSQSPVGSSRDDVPPTPSIRNDTSYAFSSDASSVAFAPPTSSASLSGAPSIDSPAAESPSSQQDTWTSCGWPKAYVRRLILLVLDWDGLPLCMVDKELFLRDFESGTGQFCSSALVSALLAIITRLLSEAHKQDEAPTRADVPASEAFVQKSSAHLRREGVALDNLPDVQAVAVLALYEASFGEDVRAANLIHEYTVAMADLCFNKPTPPSATSYDEVRSNAYRGAISLRRIFQFAGIATTLEEDHPTSFLDASKGSHDVAKLADSMSSYLPGETFSHARPCDHPQRMAAGIFQLTGWLQTVQAQPTSEQGRYSRLELYSKCLDWHNILLSIQPDPHASSNSSHPCPVDRGVEEGAGHRQFNVFTHMFYHFCILKILAPEASHPQQYTGFLRTRDICRGAAQSILSLAPLATSPEFAKHVGKSPGRLASRFVRTAASFLAEPSPAGGPSA